MAGASGILVGAQHPLCQPLNARSQPVALEIFNKLVKLVRKLMHYRARERPIRIDQLMNNSQRDKQKLTAVQSACTHWIEVVRNGRK